MYALKRLLIAMDLTEMDDVLIMYTSFLARFIQANTIYFFHAAKSLEIPDEIAEKYPDLLAPVDETIEHELRQRVEQLLPKDIGCELHFHVTEGEPSQKLLSMIKRKDIDLLVMGRKKTLQGEGRLCNKLSKVAPCTLLLVPENQALELNKIIVATDFSKHSQQAVEEAVALAGASKARLELLHVFSVPHGYHKTGKNYEEFAEVMRENALKDADKFIRKLKITSHPEVHAVLDDDKKPADKIHIEALRQRADMIVIASKGRTALASLLLGSVADNLTSSNTTIPLMVVKDKKENMGMLEALMRL